MADFQEARKWDLLSVKTVLVVDDDPEISKTLKGIIEEFEVCQVVLAANGFQALNIVRGVKPDLFLFDYRLPGMDGIELYHRLHSDREFAKIPVLFLSANASREVFEKDHLPYISKPFELEDLLQKIEALLTR